MWVKRYDEQWSWVTMVFSNREQLSHMYLNGSEVDSTGSIPILPYKWQGK